MSVRGSKREKAREKERKRGRERKREIARKRNECLSTGSIMEHIGVI